MSPFPAGDPAEDFNVYFIWIRYPESMGPGIAGTTVAYAPACRSDAEEQWGSLVDYYGADNVNLVSVAGVKLA